MTEETVRAAKFEGAPLDHDGRSATASPSAVREERARQAADTLAALGDEEGAAGTESPPGGRESTRVPGRGRDSPSRGKSPALDGADGEDASTEAPTGDAAGGAKAGPRAKLKSGSAPSTPRRKGGNTTPKGGRKKRGKKGRQARGKSAGAGRGGSAANSLSGWDKQGDGNNKDGAPPSAEDVAFWTESQGSAKSNVGDGKVTSPKRRRYRGKRGKKAAAASPVAGSGLNAIRQRTTLGASASTGAGAGAGAGDDASAPSPTNGVARSQSVHLFVAVRRILLHVLLHTDADAAIGVQVPSPPQSASPDPS